MAAGFASQLVFSMFSLGLFALSDDHDLVYGGAAAHKRMENLPAIVRRSVSPTRTHKP